MVVFFHGFGSSVTLFGLHGNRFAAAGYDFVGFDYKGFGKSEGPRGHLESAELMLADSTAFITQVKEYYKKSLPSVNLTYIGIGYSLGGALCLREHLHWKQTMKEDLFKAIVLYSPLGSPYVEDLKTDEDIEKLKENFKIDPFFEMPPPWGNEEAEFAVKYGTHPLMFLGPIYCQSIHTCLALA